MSTSSSSTRATGPSSSRIRTTTWPTPWRRPWLDYGSAPYLASLRMDQATTWEEFVEACNYSRIPSENMVWADRAGNIGYQAVGVSPIRPNHSGLVAGAGGRALRVGRVPAHQGAAQRRQPAQGLLRDGQQLHAARRARALSALGGAALYVGRPDAGGAGGGGAGQRPAHDGGRQHAAHDGRVVDCRPQPREAAGRPAGTRRGGRPRAADAARLGRGARQGIGGGGDLRGLGARVARRRASHRGSGRRPRLHPGRQHQATDRLADCPRRALRRRPARRPRRPPARDARRRAGRPRRPLRHARHDHLESTAASGSSTPSSATR